MRMLKVIVFINFFILLSLCNMTTAEVVGDLTKDLKGLELTYHYASGRKYQVSFEEDTLSYLRLDQKGREWEHGIPYISRKLDDNLYYLNWHRPEKVEFISIVLDFKKKTLYTSALLDGVDQHFDLANIVEANW